MNVWMKRALQTGLFTGGLLALGSGIASADDTLDVTVPVTVTDNALAVLGTTGDVPAEVQLPALDGTISADLGAATISVPITVGGNAADAAGIDVAQPAAAPSASQPASGGSQGSAVDADVPVTVSGNAVAVLGTSSASGTAPAGSTAGSSASIADVTVPVTACGNGIGVLGDASGNCTAPAGTTGGTDTDTLIDADAPVLVCGNGIGVLGDAAGDCTSPAAPGTPVDPTLPPIAGQPGAFPGVVAPASSGLRLPQDGGNGGSTAGSTQVSTDGELAFTGTTVTGLLLGGLLALALGLSLTVLSRRRVSTLG